MTTENPVALLKEWYELWTSSEDMPAKLPGSLHVRTAVLLAESEHEGH